MTPYRLMAMRFFQAANVLGVILTLYYQAHGLNYAEILSFEIALSLALLVATVPLGLWADRNGRVRALKAANLSFVAASLVFLMARAYWQFLVSDLLFGLGAAWQGGADIALLTPAGDVWFSRYEAVGALAGLVGSLAAGVLLQAAGSRWLIVVNVLVAVLAWLSIATVANEPALPTRPAASPWRHARRALRVVARAPGLLAWTVAGGLGFRLVAINLFFLDLPLWVDAGWHGVFLGVGVALLYASAWLGLFAPRLASRLGDHFVLTLSQAAMGAFVLLLPLLHSPWALTAAMAGAVACQALQTPISTDRVSRAVPASIRVTVLSMLDLPAVALTVLLELGVGLLADAHLAWALVASGATLLLGVPLWWIRLRGSVRVPRPRSPTPSRSA